MVASEQRLYQIIVQFDKTIVLPRKLATGRINYIFCYCPLVGILFEVLRIEVSLIPPPGVGIRLTLITKVLE